MSPTSFWFAACLNLLLIPHLASTLHHKLCSVSKWPGIRWRLIQSSKWKLSFFKITYDLDKVFTEDTVTINRWEKLLFGESLACCSAATLLKRKHSLIWSEKFVKILLNYRIFLTTHSQYFKIKRDWTYSSNSFSSSFSPSLQFWSLFVRQLVLNYFR